MTAAMRASAISAPTFPTTVRNAAAGAGAPSATSGTQACAGTDPTLNARPSATSVNPDATAQPSERSRPSGKPLIVVVAATPKSRAAP